MAARTEAGPQRWEAAAAIPITSNTKHIPVIRTQLVRFALTFVPPCPKLSSEIVGLLLQIFFTLERSTQEIDSAIHSGLASPGQAAHRINGSLPFRTFPICCDLSLSRSGLGFVKPSLRLSSSRSSALPVRNVQPGRTPCAFAYSFSARGESSSGFKVIEYMKMSRPTLSPRSLCTLARFEVIPGQTPSHRV